MIERERDKCKNIIIDKSSKTEHGAENYVLVMFLLAYIIYTILEYPYKRWTDTRSDRSLRFFSKKKKIYLSRTTGGLTSIVAAAAADRAIFCIKI